jgi:hypothetical protein
MNRIDKISSGELLGFSHLAREQPKLPKLILLYPTLALIKSFETSSSLGFGKTAYDSKTRYRQPRRRVSARQPSAG